MTEHPPLCTDMNADRWAKEFVALYGGDEDLMRTWFANAIMCGWDNHYWTTPEYKAVINKALDKPTSLITMPELSLSAQAVRDAAEKQNDLDFVYAPQIAAATLRAAADQVVPDQGDIWTRDLRGDAWIRWEERKLIRHDLLALAAEIKGKNDC